MSVYKLYRKQHLPVSLESAWAFFSSPKNLNKITPPNMNFKILAGTNEGMYAGQIIRYKINPIANIPISWVTEKATANDPFANPKRRSIRQFLQDKGVEFAAGATVISGNPNASSIIIRNTREQLDKVETIFAKLRKEKAPRQLHIVVEYIEVEAKLYHDWMFENRITGDGTPLRRQAQEWLENDQATLV